ncbi:MAG: histidine phosphatase family protein [Gammaproteobacteria bacterium]|nr:histidine phosphatase family protein [Gammaproteobacteria bacterium]
MREKEQSTRIIYVRHGKPDFPHDRLYCDDREDPVLTAEGLQQAQAAARQLASIEPDVDRIYVSPMQRARLTAEPIIQAYGVPHTVDVDLKERPFGAWDGLYFDAIERDFPDQYRAWKQDPVMFVPQGGETIHAHRDRINGVIHRIIERHPGETIVVVAHVGPIRMCVTEALQMPLESYRRLTVDYASLTRVDYGRRQHNLVYMNLYDRIRP